MFCEDYLAAEQAEYEDWWKKAWESLPNEDIWPLPEPWHSQLEATWQRLFDSLLPRLSWDKALRWSRQECFEAVFEALRLDEVRDVTIFRGAANWLPPGKSAGR